MTTKALVTQQFLIDIANAIRQKSGTSRTYRPSEMAAAILAIPTANPVTLNAVSNSNNTIIANQDDNSEPEEVNEDE